MVFVPESNHTKPRKNTIRANWWEYVSGIYHVTLATKHRNHYFGEISRSRQTNVNEMHLSPLGEFVNSEIPKIKEHYEYVSIPIWTVMPDHIHFIIVIPVMACLLCRGVRSARLVCGPHACNDPHFNDMHASTTNRMSEISPKRGSLPCIINQFKRAITLYARKNNIPFQWQSKYYDVILFNQEDFDRTYNYIKNNIKSYHI